MPEDAKPRFSHGQLVRRGIAAGIILALIAPFAWTMLFVWGLNRVAERVDKVAKDVEAEAQEANPVGSTKQQVEDWLKANKFKAFPPNSDNQWMENLIKQRQLPAKGATSYLGGERPIAGGYSDEKTIIYFFLGPDEKLILVHAEGFFIGP
jgi:hypothetical protein